MYCATLDGAYMLGVSYDAFATDQDYKDKASSRAACPCSLISGVGFFAEPPWGLVYTPRKIGSRTLGLVYALATPQGYCLLLSICMGLGLHPSKNWADPTLGLGYAHTT